MTAGLQSSYDPELDEPKKMDVSQCHYQVVFKLGYKLPVLEKQLQSHKNTPYTQCAVKSPLPAVVWLKHSQFICLFNAFHLSDVRAVSQCTGALY